MLLIYTANQFRNKFTTCKCSIHEFEKIKQPAIFVSPQIKHEKKITHVEPYTMSEKYPYEKTNKPKNNQDKQSSNEQIDYIVKRTN